MIRSKTIVVLVLAGLMTVAGCTSTDSTPATSGAKSGESGRSAEDRARDAGRKPFAVVAYLEIGRGMTVMDLLASGGYYTEVLSEAVGSNGTVYAQNVELALKAQGGAYDRQLTARLVDDRLSNVVRLDEEFDALSIEDGSLDAVFTALNFHDAYNGASPEAATSILRVALAKLKPGGILGLIDHDGSADHDNAKLHRIEKHLVVAVVEQVGFVLDGDSDLLENPADDHSQHVFAPGLRGHTDRFLLRARKP